MAKKRCLSKLLNRTGYHSTAAIATEIEINRYGKNTTTVDGTIYLSDCYRQISLDVSANDAKELKNSLYKIDTLLSVLEKTRLNLQEAYDEAHA
jgi:hypothetical protein